MKLAFNEVKLLLRGFDVVIKPSEEDNCYSVILYENTKQVAQYDVNVDFDKFEGSDADLDGSDDIYEYVGSAAIDLFESSRNTLGQGAGAMNKKTSFRKSACSLNVKFREDWFLGLKGTPYEQQALELLNSYIDSIYKKKDQTDVGKKIDEVMDKEDDAFYQLEKIYIEYMKELDPHQTVIIVQASRKISFYESGEIQEMLDTFEGTKWESQVIDLIRTILDCRVQLDNLYAEEDGGWEEQQQLQSAMDELSLVALEDKLNGKAVINQMPEMLEDMVELAAGVDFSEPLEPMGSLLSTKARKRAYQEGEAVEKENIGLSMAVDAEDEAENKFQINQEVSLNKKIEVPLWGGAVETLSSGTKGVIDTVYDDMGNDYLFRSEDGVTVRVHKDDLKKG